MGYVIFCRTQETSMFFPTSHIFAPKSERFLPVDPFSPGFRVPIPRLSGPHPHGTVRKNSWRFSEAPSTRISSPNARQVKISSNNLNQGYATLQTRSVEQLRKRTLVMNAGNRGNSMSQVQRDYHNKAQYIIRHSKDPH